MIPSIQARIDRANNDLELGDGDNNDRYRINIPSEELADLAEFRSQEHTRLVRETHKSRLLEWTQAKSRYRPVRDEKVDSLRPYGLPQGKECPFYIWEKIFERVHNVEDMINLRDSCVLFRDLLDMKYKALRFAEVMLQLGYRFGGLSILLTLRLICKWTKAAVDNWFMKDRPDQKWHENRVVRTRDNRWINKPRLSFYVPYVPTFRWISGRVFEDPEVKLRSFESIVKSVESLTMSRATFPLREIYVNETNHGTGPLNANMNNQLTLRNLVQRFLEVVGSSVSYFEFRTDDDNLGWYNRLRTWVALMPHLQELEIGVMPGRQGDAIPPVEPDEPLQAFPSCPKLKRFSNSGCGIRAPFVAQIILANPWITSVRLVEEIPHLPREIEGGEITTLREALASLHVERFNLESREHSALLHRKFIHFRFHWPLRQLTLTTFEDVLRLPSRTVFNFINSFSQTLEELTVFWDLTDTGGFLELRKVKKVFWRLGPWFMSLDFLIPLESLEYLDVDVSPLLGINQSLRNAKIFIDNMNLPDLFPALKQIRTRTLIVGHWHQMWKS